MVFYDLQMIGNLWVRVQFLMPLRVANRRRMMHIVSRADSPAECTMAGGWKALRHLLGCHSIRRFGYPVRGRSRRGSTDLPPFNSLEILNPQRSEVRNQRSAGQLRRQLSRELLRVMSFHSRAVRGTESVDVSNQDSDLCVPHWFHVSFMGLIGEESTVLRRS